VRHSHLNYLFSRNVLHLLLTSFFFTAHLLLPPQLFLQSPSDISHGFSGFEQCLNSFEIFNGLLFADGVLDYFKVFGSNRSNNEILIQFFVFGWIGAIHAAAEIDHEYHALD
jgi:hypothetical protein